jgi:transposase
VRELRDHLTAHGIGIGEEAVRLFLHAEGLSFKKKRLRSGAGSA